MVTFRSLCINFGQSFLDDEMAIYFGILNDLKTLTWSGFVSSTIDWRSSCYPKTRFLSKMFQVYLLSDLV